MNDKQSICDITLCTACGACSNICSRNAIQQHKNWDGSWYMEIDKSKCVKCGLCQKVCPNVSEAEKTHPISAYAGWSVDNITHKNSASGGIATELYKYAIRKGFYFAGTKLLENGEVHFEIGKTLDDAVQYKNSKYTYSYVDDCYKKIISLLREGNTVMFIGLPCQVAAMKNYAKIFKVERERLFLVDLVCHGTPSPEFLKQHIEYVEDRANKKSSQCSFRDPAFKTDNYVFTLRDDKGTCFYKKRILNDDNYQIGYHSAMIYRDVCYQCQYACRERTGDITIADYHGLGTKAPYDDRETKVSAILINTNQGRRVIQDLINESQLIVHERPILEPIENEKQFNEPSKAPVERSSFIKLYQDGFEFDAAANVAFKKRRQRDVVRGIFDSKRIKQLIPTKAKRLIKKIIKMKK